MTGRLGLRTGWTVLDMGTGTGVLLPYLATALGGSGRVVAIDLAGAMLRRAIGKRAAHGAGFVCADIHAIPLAAETFDAVVGYSCFPHFRHKPRALAEMHRVLRPGGRLLICHTSGRDHINRRHAQSKAVMHDMLPPADTMMTLLEAAGFRDAAIEDWPDSYLASARRAGKDRAAEE
jgi:ubiquinone/menaquinone biosynthesis C-methylase UbiE